MQRLKSHKSARASELHKAINWKLVLRAAARDAAECMVENLVGNFMSFRLDFI